MLISFAAAILSHVIQPVHTLPAYRPVASAEKSLRFRQRLVPLSCSQNIYLRVTLASAGTAVCRSN